MFITFGYYRDSVPIENGIQITINGQDLTRIDHCKYLGVIYDTNIKWGLHINKMEKKTKYLVYLFYRLKHILSKMQLIQLYYGLFHNNAVYGMIGWGGLYPKALEPSERLQNRFFNIIGINDQDTEKQLEIRQVFV